MASLLKPPSTPGSSRSAKADSKRSLKKQANLAKYSEAGPKPQVISAQAGKPQVRPAPLLAEALTLAGLTSGAYTKHF